ncbi:alanine dehydrogenase [bacterium]|nr:alanine dehydrogenase [bacterium]
MIIGVPKEQMIGEFRVGVSPGGVAALVHRGQTVYVEKDAGSGAHFTDADYRAVGAEVAHSAEEVWGRSDIVVKIKQLVRDELDYLRSGQAITGFLHLAITPREILDKLIESKITTLAYEEIADGKGNYPVVYPMSELCGRMLPQIAARYLECENGGRGVLLSGTSGIPAAEVVILGAGAVGTHAALAFYGIGAHVTVLDRNIMKLQDLDMLLSGKVNTILASRYNIRKALAYADVLIGAIHAPFRLAEHIVTRQMIKLMRPRGVAIDVAIDQGGCFETSRPTTLFNPSYVVEGITHYCVPNMTSSVARTASNSITNSFLPFLFDIVEAGGVEQAIKKNEVLATGSCIEKGIICHPLLEQVYSEKLPGDVEEEE